MEERKDVLKTRAREERERRILTPDLLSAERSPKTSLTSSRPPSASKLYIWVVYTNHRSVCLLPFHIMLIRRTHFQIEMINLTVFYWIDESRNWLVACFSIPVRLVWSVHFYGNKTSFSFKRDICSVNGNCNVYHFYIYDLTPPFFNTYFCNRLFKIEIELIACNVTVLGKDHIR